jgi:hypothetical protein
MPQAVILNQTFVRQLLPGEDPSPNGSHWACGWRLDPNRRHCEDGKYRSLGEGPITAYFRPMEQAYDSKGANFAVKDLSILNHV